VYVEVLLDHLRADDLRITVWSTIYDLDASSRAACEKDGMQQRSDKAKVIAGSKLEGMKRHMM
jgi:hypothetical protein